MPYKTCPKCNNGCGVRTLKCSCGYEFISAKTKGYGVSKPITEQINQSNEPTGMLFRKVKNDILSTSLYDINSLKTYSDISGKYFIRYAPKLSLGVPVAHDNHYAALMKIQKYNQFTFRTESYVELIGFYSSLYKADMACKLHKEGKLPFHYARIQLRKKIKKEKRNA